MLDDVLWRNEYDVRPYRERFDTTILHVYHKGIYPVLLR